MNNNLFVKTSSRIGKSFGAVEFLSQFVDWTAVIILQCFLNRWLSEPGLYIAGNGISSISVGIRLHYFKPF